MYIHVCIYLFLKACFRSAHFTYCMVYSSKLLVVDGITCCHASFLRHPHLVFDDFFRKCHMPCMMKTPYYVSCSSNTAATLRWLIWYFPNHGNIAQKAADQLILVIFGHSPAWYQSLATALLFICILYFSTLHYFVLLCCVSFKHCFVNSITRVPYNFHRETQNCLRCSSFTMRNVINTRWHKPHMLRRRGDIFVLYFLSLFFQCIMLALGTLHPLLVFSHSLTVGFITLHTLLCILPFSYCSFYYLAYSAGIPTLSLLVLLPFILYCVFFHLSLLILLHVSHSVFNVSGGIFCLRILQEMRYTMHNENSTYLFVALSLSFCIFSSWHYIILLSCAFFTHCCWCWLCYTPRKVSWEVHILPTGILGLSMRNVINAMWCNTLATKEHNVFKIFSYGWDQRCILWPDIFPSSVFDET